MDDTLTDAILENAQGPAKASNDVGMFEARTIDELIAADKYLKGQEAADLPRRGIRFTKLVPPGTA